MKLKVTYLFIYLFIYLNTNAQINLVPNASFEDTIGDCQSQLFISTFYHKVKQWYVPSYYNSPDYYNNCSNAITYPHWSTIPYNAHCYQTPHFGEAFLGIYNYIISDPVDSSKIDVEYVSVKLNKSLSPNICYYGEMYINLGNIGEIAVNQMSMLFTQSTFTTSQFSYTNTIQPQIQWDTTKYFTDTLNWIKISGKFVAQGGEQYLTIGNFKDGLHTKKTHIGTNFIPGFASWPNPKFYSYMLIDDVALYEISTPQLQSNTITICPNSDTLILGDTARIHTNCQWFVNGIPIANTSFIKVKPSQTTTYVLQSTNCTTTTQTIVVTCSNNCESVVVIEPIIPNVFTPNNDSINDVWRFNLGKGNTLKDMSIFNRWGNLIYQKTNNLSQTTVLWDGKTTSGEETPSGVYFYILQYNDANGDEHKKNGYITLIK